MYPVSDAYKLAMKERVQKFKIQGTIGTTSFTDANILAGSLSIQNQCSGTENIDIGQVYIGELDCTFIGLPIERNSWFGKEISISFGQCLSDGSCEFIPLGVFTVSEASYTESGVVVKAYDHMAKLDKKCSSLDAGATPFFLARKACQACGVTLDTSEAEFSAFPNGGVTLGFFAENDIETYRDVISWIAQTCCCFATASRSGGIIFKQYGSEPVDTIDDEHRFTGCSFSDYSTRYTGMSVVNMETQTTNYYSVLPDDGLTYNLGSNPFLQIPVSHSLTIMRRNILNALASLDFVPFEATCIGNPTYDLGDALVFTSGIADGNKKSVITGFAWVYGRGYAMKGVGKNPALASASSKSDKNISGLISQTSSELYKCMVVRNAEEVIIGDMESKSVVKAYYLLGGPSHVRFNFEVLLTVTSGASESGNLASVSLADRILTLMPQNPVVVKAIYKSDNEEITERYPIETWQSGKHVLTLQYDIDTNDALAHLFELWLEVSGGSVLVAPQDAYMVVSSTGLASNSNWEGTFRDEDGNLYIVIDGVAHKIPDYIEVANYPRKVKYQENEPLDYTGVVVKAVFGDGSKTTITENCLFTPINGAPFDSATDTYIEVQYTIWTVRYATGFDLNNVKLASLQVVNPPKKIEYYDNEIITYKGLKLAIVQTNGESSDVTADCSIVPPEGTVFSYAALRTVTGLNHVAITAPEKTKYIEGEYLDFTGMEVWAFFDDGSAQNVTYEAIYSPSQGTRVYESGSTTATFTTTAGETATASFEYRVVTITNVEFIPPTKLIYKSGEKLDYTGAEVIATDSDGFTWDVTAFAVFENNEYASTEQTSISVSYTDPSEHAWRLSAPITVLSLVSLRGSLLKTYEFRVGDIIMYFGNTFIATYSDGSTEDVTEFVEYSIEPGETAKASMSGEVTVTYTTLGGDSISTTVPINIIMLERIYIEQMPVKTLYHVGEALDTTGLIVKAVYSDQSIETVTEFCQFNPQIIAKDTSKIRILYGNPAQERALIYYAISVSASEMVRIEVIKEPCAIPEEEIKYDGIEVNAVFDDDYVMPIPKESLTFDPEIGTTFSEAGTQACTVSYGNLSAPFNLTISDIEILKYLTYTVSGNSISLTALNRSKILEDDLSSVIIPSQITAGTRMYDIIIS